MANKNLNQAKNAKKDEFYTQLVDIENELRHYRDHFRGKTVLCNCDDPRVSNFFHYFSYNFEQLGLKKLINRYNFGDEVVCENENWKIEGHNNERDTWTLSYNGRPLVECLENYAYFIEEGLSYENACKVAGVIEVFYGHDVDLSKYKNEE